MEHWDETAHYPKDAIQAAHEMGLLNLHIPEIYGGAKPTSFEEVLVNEELAWGDPGFATSAYATALASAPITAATEDQKEILASKIAEEGALASYAVTEPGAGSDVAACKTTAIRDGDEYVINYQKCGLPALATLDFFFVLAKTDPDAGYRGMSGFVVENGTEGFSLGKKEVNMGQRCSDTRSISFDDVRVPADHLIGGSESGGWMNAMKAFDMSRPNMFAHATGLARAAYEHALQYSNERQTFESPSTNIRPFSSCSPT